MADLRQASAHSSLDQVAFSHPVHEKNAVDGTDAAAVHTLPHSPNSNQPGSDTKDYIDRIGDDHEAGDDQFPDRADDVIHKNQQQGISRIEAFRRVYGFKSPVAWLLYFCLLLVSFLFCFDQSTTAAYDSFSQLYFNNNTTLYGTIQSIEGVIIAVSKPFLAKTADVFSRQTTYMIILVCYVVGYIVVASAQNSAAILIGRVISASGQAGLDLMTDIIWSDLTPLEWRGFALAMTSFPYIFLPFVGSKISGTLCSANGASNNYQCFRWGYGMFTIMAPVLVMPVILTLIYADRQAVKHGELSFASGRNELTQAKQMGSMHIGKRMNLRSKLSAYFNEFDFFGLILLGVGFTMLLLAFSLQSDAKGGWSNPSMIAMIVVGPVILGLFLLWEIFLSKKPLLPRRVLFNRTFLSVVCIDILNQGGGTLRGTWFYPFLYAIRPWEVDTIGYLYSTETASLTVFGLSAGLYMRYFHRYKPMQVVGQALRIVGFALAYWATRSYANSQNTAVLVWVFLFLGLGGLATSSTRVAAQASVPHQDLATVTAQLSLWTKLAGSIGSGIANAVYGSNYMNNFLEHGFTREKALAYKTGSGLVIHTRIPWGSNERINAIGAYSATIRPLCLAALIISFFPFLICLTMPNYYMGKRHNAVDHVGVDGKAVHEEADDKPANSQKSWLARAWNA